MTTVGGLSGVVGLTTVTGRAGEAVERDMVDGGRELLGEAAEMEA